MRNDKVTVARPRWMSIQVRGRTVFAFLVVALGLAGPGDAAATPASGPHETVDVTFSTTLPNTSAGLTYSATYRNPANPQTNPPALRRVVITGPAGIKGDTSVPGLCTATDMQLKLSGESACPAASRVGSGAATTSMLGSPPATYDTALFNADHEQIELVKFATFGAGVVRSTIYGATIDGLVPTCVTGGQPPNGCPSDQVVLLSNRLTTLPISGGPSGGNYLTTPPTCPPSGRWQTSVTLYYADGTVETVVPQQPCSRVASGRHARRRVASGRRGARHLHRVARGGRSGLRPRLTG